MFPVTRTRPACESTALDLDDATPADKVRTWAELTGGRKTALNCETLLRLWYHVSSLQSGVSCQSCSPAAHICLVYLALFSSRATGGGRVQFNVWKATPETAQI